MVGETLSNICQFTDLTNPFPAPFSPQLRILIHQVIPHTEAVLSPLSVPSLILP